MGIYQPINRNRETLKNSRGYKGQGVATYPNGDVYDGHFLDGVRKREINFVQLRHGDGTYKYAAKGGEEAQDSYKGQWENNLKHGIGKQVYTGVGEYYGYWAHGQRNGEGVMTYTNKDVYSGQWKDGKKNGQGTYIFFQTGMKYVGQWAGGQMVAGQWKYPNGTQFEGTFDNNKPKGKGSWKFDNGNQVEGEYTQTRRADVDGDDIKLAWKTTSDITAPVKAAE